MEDRYLFRAKRKKWELFPEAQQWVQGYYVHTAESDYIVSPYEHTTLLGEGETVEIEVNTLCQCTGRTDRDEKLIFEHDVIAYLDTYSTESGYAEADCAGEVLWDEETLSFQVTNRLSAESFEVLGGECKVLGNAIEHPELLEVE